MTIQSHNTKVLRLATELKTIFALVIWFDYQKWPQTQGFYRKKTVQNSPTYLQFTSAPASNTQLMSK